jgi:ABC-type nitrate/sulfonate/bicarbonate transport system permease component
MTAKEIGTPWTGHHSTRSHAGTGRGLADRALPVAATLALLGAWEVASRTGALPSEVPPPTRVASWLAAHATQGDFWCPVGDTATHWFGGLLIGAALGVALGILLGLTPLLEQSLRVPLEFLRPIPSIVYLPLLILMLGSRSVTAIIVAAIGALWPVLFQTFYGVLGIDSQAVETGRVFGLRRRQILWNIMLPSVLPYVAVGLRVGSSLALVVAISAELIGGVPGLGTEILAAAQNGRYEATYGLVVVVGVFGLILNAVLEQAEGRLLPWHQPHRKVEQ